MKTSLNNRQEGASMLGIIILLSLATFFLTVVFKVGPLYLDDWAVKNSFAALENENIRDMSESDVRRKLENYFIVNNVRNIRARDVKIKRDREKIVVSHDYETRTNFMANLDVVVRFTHKYDTSQPR